MELAYNPRFQRSRAKACGYLTWDIVDTSIAAE